MNQETGEIEHVLVKCEDGMVYKAKEVVVTTSLGKFLGNIKPPSFFSKYGQLTQKFEISHDIKILHLPLKNLIVSENITKCVQNDT